MQWRIFVKTLNSQQRLVVAQKIAVRDMVARESATATLIPYLISVEPQLLKLDACRNTLSGQGLQRFMA